VKNDYRLESFFREKRSEMIIIINPTSGFQKPILEATCGFQKFFCDGTSSLQDDWHQQAF
jgi:hypothetical protein